MSITQLSILAIANFPWFTFTGDDSCLSHPHAHGFLAHVGQVLIERRLSLRRSALPFPPYRQVRVHRNKRTKTVVPVLLEGIGVGAVLVGAPLLLQLVFGTAAHTLGQVLAHRAGRLR